MQRFVYAPKVEAFVMLEQSKRLIDLSDDIISGTVNRRVNAMSDASLTLQNKLGKYTEKVRIEPMDRIVIRMSRVGQPFAVLSGFVDDAPFYQLYPGPVTLSASCTLKLLQHTYFDPALIYLHSYFAGLGWNYDPASGTITDGRGSFGNQDLSGSMGDILYAMLRDIAGWPADHIDIRDLPDVFIKSIAKLMHDAAEEADEIYEQQVELLERLFKSEVAAGTQPGGQLGPVGPGVEGNVAPVDIAIVAIQAGFKGDGAVNAVAYSLAESSGVSNGMGWNTNATYDVGLWQINTIHTAGGGSGMPRPEAGSSHYTFKQPQDWNKVKANVPAGVRTFVENCFNPKFNASQAYAISSQGTNWSPWYANPTDDHYTIARKAVLEAQEKLGSAGTASKSIDYDAGGKDTAEEKSQAAKRATKVDPPYYPLAKRASSQGTPADHRTRAFGNWQSDRAYDLIVPIGTPVIAPEDGVIVGPMGFQPKGPYHRQVNPPEAVVRASFAGNPSGQSLYLGDANGNQKLWFTHLLRITVKEGQRVKAGDIIGYSGSGNGVEHLHFAMNTNSDDAIALYIGRPTVDGTQADGGMAGGSGTTDASGNLTPAQVAAIAARAQFFQVQLGGGDVHLAAQLSGKRAIQNDVTLMEWINNLVPASGRVFTSKPNGDFLSFFPDYFGYFERTPYFRIADIEITDLNINKNDTELTTHVFAVGPTVNKQTITTFDEIRSMVASVEDPGLKYFINVTQGDLVSTPITFLQRYGARPFKYDLPNVTHPMLLWMAAWMKFSELWAKRFTAHASFTFMPELFPGGLVSLGDRIQMYVESVSHSFDMNGGFTTSAELSAPAGLSDEFIGELGKAGFPAHDANTSRQDRTNTDDGLGNYPRELTRGKVKAR